MRGLDRAVALGVVHRPHEPRPHGVLDLVLVDARCSARSRAARTSSAGRARAPRARRRACTPRRRARTGRRSRCRPRRRRCRPERSAHGSATATGLYEPPPSAAYAPARPSASAAATSNGAACLTVAPPPARAGRAPPARARHRAGTSSRTRSSLPIELVDERGLERPVRRLVMALERRRDVRHAALRALDFGEHVLRDPQLVERRNAAVEHGCGAGRERLVLVPVERRREQRREQEQAEHDAGVPGRDRPPAVQHLRRAPGSARSVSAESVSPRPTPTSTCGGTVHSQFAHAAGARARRARPRRGSRRRQRERGGPRSARRSASQGWPRAASR